MRGDFPDSAAVLQQVDKLAVDLELSAIQKDKVLKLEQSHFDEMRTMRAEISQNREVHQQMMEKERENHSAQMKSILNEAQYAKWLETHQQRLQERKHDGSGMGRGNGRGNGGGRR